MLMRERGERGQRGREARKGERGRERFVAAEDKNDSNWGSNF